MSASTVSRNPMFHVLDEQNIDTFSFQRLHSSGKTKKTMQSRRSLDNARNLQKNICEMSRKNGKCKVFTKEEIALFRKSMSV